MGPMPPQRSCYDLRGGGMGRRPPRRARPPIASLFPALGRSDGVVGGLRPGVAAGVGLPAGTPVVLGGADSQACALGAGVVRPGTGQRDGRLVDLPERGGATSH